jgi:predicted PurR-regulated permease PerM
MPRVYVLWYLPPARAGVPQESFISGLVLSIIANEFQRQSVKDVEVPLTRKPPAHSDPARGESKSQQIARSVLILVLCLVGLWMLSGLLPALLWALVLAVSTWPVRDWIANHIGDTPAAACVTALIAVILVLPLMVVGVLGAREAISVLQWLRELRQAGLGTPTWVSELPLIGSSVATWWQDNLADPETARALLGRAESLQLLSWTRTLGTQLVSRLAILLFTLLTLFFLFRDGRVFLRQSLRVGSRLFGPSARELAANAGATIGATVNGLVFVGLGEGLLMGVAYFAAGLSHPLLFTTATAILAIIPFGAPLVFVVAALMLVAESQVISALLVFAFGMAVVFVADHFVRPILIGSATRLPFLFVLFGIFGGLETFGLIGLFLGPAIMSVLFALWKETAASGPARFAKSTHDNIAKSQPTP